MPRPARALSMPAPKLMTCMSWNGMDWGSGRPHITRSVHIDAAVVTALRLLNVPIQTRDVQIELTNMVDEATAFAQNRVPVPDEYLERPQFLDEYRETSRLGKRLSSGYFEQLFTAIVLARYRYLEDRYLEDLPLENPATHCHLARAVDAFEKAAWFWSSVEAFLEDDQGRADDIKRLTTLLPTSHNHNHDLPPGPWAVRTRSSAATAAGDVGSEK